MRKLVLLTWFFFQPYGGSDIPHSLWIMGPFATQEKCEDVRQAIPGTQPCWKAGS